MLIISPHVVSPHATDFRSLASILASPRLAGKRGQDLAIAIWELFVDKAEGLYHYCPALERATGHFVYDPVKLFNVHGWSICGVTANTMVLLYEAAGFDEARVADLKGHEATEVYYDGGWHLMDGDLQAYHRKHPPEQETIASYADCLADPTLVSRQENPSEPYYLPDRSPEGVANLYAVEPHTGPAFVDHSHTMDFVLRPGEMLERTTQPQGRWIWFDNFGEFRQRFGGEWSDDGPRERFEPHRQYANGRWLYEPRLTGDYLDFEAGALEAVNVHATARGVEPAGDGPAHCTFELNSPWALAGVPLTHGARRPTGGCLVRAHLRHNDPNARVRILLAVDPDVPWTEVWASEAPGEHEVRLDLTEHVPNAYRLRLRFDMGSAGSGSCVLDSLRVESWFMIAPASIGRLVEGDNELTVRFGDDTGLPTVRRLIETDFGDEADVSRKAFRVSNLEFLPGTDDRILPAGEGEYEIVYRIDAPPHEQVQRVFVHGSVRGKAPGDPAGHVAAEWSADENGPWHAIYDEPVREVPHRWHFAAEGAAELDRPRERLFVRLIGTAGMKTGRIRLHCTDDRTAAAPPPLTISHEWTEADGAVRKHTQRVASPNASHSYTLTCGQAPRLRRLILRAGSLVREGAGG